MEGRGVRAVGLSRRVAEGALLSQGQRVSWKAASHCIWDPGELALSQDLGPSHSLLTASLCLRKLVLLVEIT